jgi:amidohydrolase
MNKSEIVQLTNFRKELHSYPELSGQEAATSDRIKAFFKNLNPDEWIEDLGGYGLAVVFKGHNPGPVTLLRAELDALPIMEHGNLKYKSQVAGVSHLCGHDGHMTILCGVGLELSKEKPKNGNVVLLFQPAEETGEGASKVLNSENFRKIVADFAFALHNLPGYDKNQIILKKGAFTAASVGMIIRFTGHTSHAAHPEDGNSPAEAMCKSIVGLEILPDSISEFSMITVIHAVLGEVAFGTTPGEATVMATLRTYDNEVLERLRMHATDLVELIAKEYRLNVSVSFRDSFQAVVNEEKAWDYVNQSAKKLKMKTKHIRTPFRWSEDFGQFSNVTNTLLFGIGAGRKHPQLHESIYDFPDELIPTGVNLFTEVIRKINF